MLRTVKNGLSAPLVRSICPLLLEFAILSVLNTERRITMDRIIDVTNLSENKIRTAIELMIEEGLIEASGRGKNRTFILGAKIYK